MKILLVNCDARFNIALNKLYTYYITKGDSVDFINCRFDYFNKYEKQIICASDYDNVYVSAIFENSLDKLTIRGNKNIDIGGTGSIDCAKRLPDYIDCLEPYNNTDTYYNFITRGCIRNCYWCKVRQCEGDIRLNKHPKDMNLLKRNIFLDNNILAYDKHIEILEYLVDNNITYQFNQGLDFRLTNEDNLSLLSTSKYIDSYIFAFDDIKYLDNVKEKLPIIRSYIRKDFKTMWYCYVNINDNPDDLTYRVKYLKSNRCLSYISRDKNCYENNDVCNYYKDLGTYCNHKQYYRTLSFEKFLEFRHKNTDRINKSLEYWERVQL